MNSLRRRTVFKVESLRSTQTSGRGSTQTKCHCLFNNFLITNVQLVHSQISRFCLNLNKSFLQAF